MRRLLLLTSLCFVVAVVFAPAALAQQSKQSIDCDDFASQAVAQMLLDHKPSDPFGLDADGDGTACEDFFGATASPTSTAQYAQYATATTLPATGGPTGLSLITVAATLALVGSGIVAGTLLLRRSVS